MKKNKKRKFIRNQNKMIRISRWVSIIHQVCVIIFFIATLFLDLETFHHNVYLTLWILADLIENMFEVMAFVRQEIFENNKIRHIIFSSMPVNVYLLFLITFWPVTIVLINIPIGFLFKIIISVIFARILVGIARSITNHFLMKIVEVEE